MLITPINTKLNFSRAFTTQEKADANIAKNEALKLLGNNERILIVPELSMPKNETSFIGVGQLNTQKSYEFLEFMKTKRLQLKLKLLL